MSAKKFIVELDAAGRARLDAMIAKGKAPAMVILKARIPDATTLKTEVAAWQTSRNGRCAKASWRFTTADARIKLKTLYPVMLGG